MLVFRSNHSTRVATQRHLESKVRPEQEAIIKMYAERVGEKIRKLVSEIIVDSLTLLWAEKPIASQSTVREQPVQ